MADEQIEVVDRSQQDPGSSASVDERVADAEANGRPADAQDRASSLHQVWVADQESTRDQAPALSYPVVGFGASAGGLIPLKVIMEALPVDTGMAFVVVTHLAPDHVSHLREITETFTAMPVHAITNGVRPEPNNVYVLQPNEKVQLAKGMFLVSSRDLETKPFKAIDLFFYSLGADQKNHAIGVVLSGGDSDGALGLKAIKGEGGLAIVQAPETAQHSSMPRNSISADHVDMVIAPGEIAVELARLAKQFQRPEVRSLESGEDIPNDTQLFTRILQMLRAASGLELRQYKPDTIRRRIARRMVLLRMETLADYLRYLNVRRDELTNLQEDVLINVTRFFRDQSFWLALQGTILPTFFQDRPAERPIRIWSAGCASGEEAYSLAITILEYMSNNGIDSTVQIFGTDASERSIEMARSGVYPETIAGEVGADRLRRFFVKTDRGYQVNKRVRDLCIFARQNLCNDPPFSHIDILSCRNVLIYFNQNLQRQVISTFHYALDLNGYLLLGLSESLREYDDAFAAADRKNKMYTKLGGSPPGGYNLPLRHTLPSTDIAYALPGLAQNSWSELELQRAADRIVLARFGPPGLIVDERMNVLQARGQTSSYVELASGSVTWHLLRILREGLAAPVRQALERAITENIPVQAKALLIEEDGLERTVQVDVLPISSPESPARTFMILFDEERSGRLHLSPEQPLSPQLTADDKERLIVQLKQDLTSTRFHLQSLIEERDARNQELVSANEEIQSANEELQSTNEELETTKEELQSANEELQTVNDELQQRNAVLSQTGNDLTNLLTSVNIPLLMLTDDLRIRQFTPPMERLLNIRSADVGRSIREIRLQLSVENIEPILHEVLDTLGTREIEVQDREGKWHLLRVRPYRTSENKIEGLVVVLVDIDQLRKTQLGLQESRDFADSVAESVPVPVAVLAKDCTIRKANTAFRELVHAPARELTGQSFPELVNILWGLDGFKDRLNDLMDAEAGTILEFEHHSTTSEKKIFLVKGQALSTDGSRVVLLAMEDITLRRHAEQLIEGQKLALEREIEETNRNLSRAQQELQGLTAHLLTLQEEERSRIARELHDDVAQRLSALQMQQDALAALTDAAERQRGDQQLSQALTDLNTEVRRISHRLHPMILEDLGLVAAMQELLAQHGEREQTIATLLVNDLQEELPIRVSTTVYRVAQEALRNVAKHAGKAQVKAILEQRDGRAVVLEVRDLGLGFDPQEDHAGGLGMISMKERARIAGGTLRVESALGRGTTVLLEVPLEEGTHEEADGPDCG